MGKIKELVMEVEDMLLNGYDIEDVSIILGMPIEEVERISKSLFDTDSNENYEPEF